jgi:hypothetical protein
MQNLMHITKTPPPPKKKNHIVRVECGTCNTEPKNMAKNIDLNRDTTTITT